MIKLNLQTEVVCRNVRLHIPLVRESAKVEVSRQATKLAHATNRSEALTAAADIVLALCVVADSYEFDLLAVADLRIVRLKERDRERMLNESFGDSHT